MKQTAKKVLALSLATLSLSLTGCGLGQQVEQKLDETMTQLRISVYTKSTTCCCTMRPPSTSLWSS